MRSILTDKLVNEVTMSIRQHFRVAPNSSHSLKRNLVNNQEGSYLVFSALAILVLFSFAAFGIDVGRWYVIQAEMSKTVDGAAFAGAANIGNFNNEAALNQMVQDVANANFPAGMIGTENLAITVANDGRGKITVDGNVNSVNPIARVMDKKYKKTAIGSSGSAKLRKFEIVLVLDESLSMIGTPLDDLKVAAKAFVNSFQGLENDPENKMGLVSFASGVEKKYALNSDYVDELAADGALIDQLSAAGWTNSEEALDRVTDDGSENMGISMDWSDETGLPPNERKGQYIVFFSDGKPTAFRAPFSTNGSAPVEAAVRFGWDGSYGPLSLRQLDQQHASKSVGGDSGKPIPSGNGVGYGPRYSSTCTGWHNRNSWKWWILDPNYDQTGYSSNPYSVDALTIYGESNPVHGMDPISCITSQELYNYGLLVAKQMAVNHATEIKTQNLFQIYTIGLGDDTQIEPQFLAAISSGPEFQFRANASSDLTAIFQEISKRIRLVLTS